MEINKGMILRAFFYHSQRPGSIDFVVPPFLMRFVQLAVQKLLGASRQIAGLQERFPDASMRVEVGGQYSTGAPGNGHVCIVTGGLYLRQFFDDPGYPRFIGGVIVIQHDYPESGGELVL